MEDIRNLKPNQLDALRSEGGQDEWAQVRTETEARNATSILAELDELNVLEAKEFQEGVAFHAFKFSGRGL